LSATLTVVGGAASGGNLTVTVNRNASPAAYTESYASAQPGRPGTFTASIRFYSQPAGAGSVVAEGQATVNIGSDGNGIGSIAVANKVETVTVAPGQSTTPGSSTQLTFTARDSNGAIVPVSAGSALWSQVDGAANMTLTVDGLATGLQPGTSNVRVTVDGVASAAIPVTVPVPDFQDPGFEQLNVAPGQYLLNSKAAPTAWGGNPNWGVSDQDSAWGRSAHGGSQFGFVHAFNDGEEFRHGAIFQSVSGLTPGATYRVTLWIARRDGTAAGIQTGNEGATFSLVADATTILSNVVPNADGSWSKVVSASFVATQTRHVFEIETASPEAPENSATLFDDIHLERID
jgi:hypothetical protein